MVYLALKSPILVRCSSVRIIYMDPGSQDLKEESENSSKHSRCVKKLWTKSTQWTSRKQQCMPQFCQENTSTYLNKMMEKIQNLRTKLSKEIKNSKTTQAEINTEFKKMLNNPTRNFTGKTQQIKWSTRGKNFRTWRWSQRISSSSFKGKYHLKVREWN